MTNQTQSKPVTVKRTYNALGETGYVCGDCAGRLPNNKAVKCPHCGAELTAAFPDLTFPAAALAALVFLFILLTRCT